MTGEIVPGNRGKENGVNFWSLYQYKKKEENIPSLTRVPWGRLVPRTNFRRMGEWKIIVGIKSRINFAHKILTNIEQLVKEKQGGDSKH